VLSVCEADNGDIVVGTDGGGIYIITDTGISYRGTDSGLMSDVVMKVKKDKSRDIFWIVTSNSLAYMDSSYKITTVKNFPYSNNFDIYENSRGDMWVLSSNGIYVVSVEQMLKNEEITPVYYGKDNGLFCIPTSNSYSELTNDGDLFIAGTTGVAKVNIENPFESVENIKMSVPFIEADGEAVYPNDSGEFVIPAETRKLTIYSFVFNYSLLNPQVTYRLEGFDHKSTTVRRTELKPIDYTNLKGGSYDFVMDIDDVNADGSKELIVHIIKEKTFTEKLWFKMTCFFGIIILIVILVKLLNYGSKKYYMKKEQEQKTLIREIVEAFAKVIDMKDRYTNGHSTRVAEYTVMLAQELGLDEETIEKYHNIALLHDIGKVGIKPEVLNKQGTLTDEEFAQIKAHSALGYNTLKDISIMPELAIGAGAHHERPDGKGYPKGLKGNEIPRVAQIIAVADTFDAMYSDRPYRKRMNFDKAVSIIREVRGTQLAEDVVDAFLRLVDKGKFRAPDDVGGGTTEDIDNIRKKAEKKPKAPEKKDESSDEKTPENDSRQEEGKEKEDN
ncbi:MAG: HD domain-containing protein, partial [Ruminococcus sp.]|nr:HD domain-containing protein [Ruminococcus sp.]